MGWPKMWTSLDHMSRNEYITWLNGFNHDSQRGKDEAVRMLRDGNVAQEIWEKAGGYDHFSTTPVLLSELREYSNGPDETRLFVEGEEALEGSVRGMRIQAPQTGASHRPGQPEQRPVEHSDALQALPRLLAHYGKKAWQDGSWENATPRVATVVAARVDRLKAIGNGQVPQVVRLAWHTLHERLMNR